MRARHVPPVRHDRPDATTRVRASRDRASRDYGVLVEPQQPRERRNPWWAVALVYAFGGILFLVAGRMLPWQDQDRQDPEY